MSARLAILDYLSQIDGDDADRLLLDALSVVQPERQAQLVDTLLVRNKPAGLQGLPAAYSQLEPDARQLMIEKVGTLFGALRTSVRSSKAQTRQNSLEIISQSGDARLAYLAAHAMHDGSPRIRAQAATTLSRLADMLASRTLSQSRRLINLSSNEINRQETSEVLHRLSEDREFLITALSDAVNHYESHHRNEVIQAALPLALDLQDVLLKQSTISRGKLTFTIQELLSDKLQPEHVPYVYVALAFPDLRRRLVALIQRSRETPFFVEMIRWSWLARDPRVRKHLGAIRQVDWLNDEFDTAFNLPPDVACRAADWILKLGLPVNRKISLLLNLMIVDHPDVNRAAVRALTQINSPDGTMALQGLVDHDDARVQQIAKIELRRRERGARQFKRSRFMRNRPEDWARLIESAGISEEFESIWQNFERLDATLADKAGKCAFQFVTDFETRLQVKLLSKTAVDRLRALRLVRTFNIGPNFEKDVFRSANDTLADIRAVAIAILGGIGGETSRRILERSLQDKSPEVVSSGIDALDAVKAPRRLELVLPLVKSDDADVRASAIRCLLRLKQPTAASELLKMLVERRSDHRCAALWIIDQLKLHTILDRVRVMGTSDPDRRIARIAQHVAKRLERHRQQLAGKAVT